MVKTHALVASVAMLMVTHAIYTNIHTRAHTDSSNTAKNTTHAHKTPHMHMLRAHAYYFSNTHQHPYFIHTSYIGYPSTQTYPQTHVTQ